MSDSPLVSVVIDNYNYARFLGAAIDSALGQTYERVEVLVVDDGSTDDSLQVIDAYGPRIRSLRRSNGGQASAMNAGLAAASGDIVVMLDADDTLAADVLARAVEIFRRDPQCVRVQWRLEVIDEQGRPIGRRNPPDGAPLLSGDLSRYVARHHLFRAPPASGNAYRAETLRSLPPVPEDTFRQYVDRWWSELTAVLGPIAALPGTGGSYRVHGGNHTRRAGRGLDYFVTRLELTRILHEQGRRLAREQGRASAADYAADVAAAPDAAYLGWRIARHKLSPEPVERPAQLVRVLARALLATARQPGLAARTRAFRLGWLLALAAMRHGGRAAARVVDARYSRER